MNRNRNKVQKYLNINLILIINNNIVINNIVINNG